jgi:hypothetical protein
MIKVAFIVHLICWFFVSKEGIGKTESGKAFVKAIDTNAVDIFKWRANSAIASDLKRLANFFKIITLSGLGTTFILAFFHD